MKLIYAFLFCFGLGLSSHAYDVPALTGPVMDTAHMLSAEGSSKIEDAIRETYKEKFAQIQVVTIPSLGEEAIEQVGIQFANKWKIGDAKEGNQRKDNGLIILVAAKERKVRIEVGQGLEGDIPDAIASRIIHEVMIPYFKNGDPDSGVLAGVISIHRVLSGQDLPVSSESRSGGRSSSASLIFFIFLFMIIGWPAIFALLGGGVRGGRGGWYGGGGGFGGGGFGGSGGGWSGGGGGFSGGGASGGW